MHAEPTTMTILTTYRCNAECRECCFESNPRLTHRLSIEQIKSAIDNAKKNFPAIKIIVFSGGETFLLKQDLFDAIYHANKQGFQTRCVTNGFWGKTAAIAERTVHNLLQAGISEINISTGSDHQEFIPFDSVVTAASKLVESGIKTLLTIEADKPDSDCLKVANENPKLTELRTNYGDLFTLQSNAWMPFRDTYEDRPAQLANEALFSGCTQLLSNMVVTPYNKLSTCCGLTFEHIPEMTIGDLEKDDMRHLYETARNDFLKIWIHTDGPLTIMRKLFGEEVDEELAQFKHQCQACVILHKHPKIRTEIQARYKEFIPNVLARYSLKNSLNATINSRMIEIYKLPGNLEKQ